MIFGQILAGRTLLEIKGEEATEFLSGLITCEIESLSPFGSAFGALLTPQGKILFDFFLVKLNDGYLFDVHDSIADEFMKRLTFYRLRKKVTIEKSSTYSQVTALWDGAPQSDHGLLVKDPRLEEMGWRHYSHGDGRLDYRDGNYNAYRISLGMPDGGTDYVYGEVFPHDTLMDQFGGVDFKKGCFVGQEVVSRMQHRGTARKRMVKLLSNGIFPPCGTTILVNDRNVGTLGASVGQCALGLVRLDRVADALKSQAEITAGEAILDVELPKWVSFTLDADS